jgi:ABC-2 type transport system ATP-binding protein
MSVIIETDALRKEYGTLVAVRDADLRIESGQVVGLVGPNGAGKTTLLRMLATLLRPTRGSARVLGRDILKDYLDVRRHIGFMPDFFNLYNDLTLEECLRFFSAAYRTPTHDLEARITNSLQVVDLTDKRQARIQHLSRGMTQRFGVACMLVHEPDLFLLDEPASGLDPKARIQLRRVLQRLAAEGRTVIISSHILTELEALCTDLCIMHGGRIVESGSVANVIQKVTGGSHVEVTLLKPDPRAVEIVKALDFVEEVTTEADVMQVRMPPESAALAALNRALVTAGIDVTRLAPKEHKLEHVFMEIAQREEVSHVA